MIDGLVQVLRATGWEEAHGEAVGKAIANAMMVRMR
jgi:hypothetical protein